MGMNPSQLLGGQNTNPMAAKNNKFGPAFMSGLREIPPEGFSINPPSNSWSGTNFMQPPLGGLSTILKNKGLPGSGTPPVPLGQKPQGFQGLLSLLSGGDISSQGGGLMNLLQQLFSKGGGKSGMPGMEGIGSTLTGALGGGSPLGGGGAPGSNPLLDALARLRGGATGGGGAL